VVTAINAFERVHPDRPLSPDDVTAFLKFHLTHSKKVLSFPVDAESLSYICHQGNFCPHADLELTLKLARVVEHLVSPPPESREELERILTSPQAHLGLVQSMLQNPADFFLEERVIKSIISAFFRVLWSGQFPNQLDVVVLEGDRVVPQAMVFVRAAKDCPSFYGYAFASRGFLGHHPRQLTVCHPDACAAYLTTVATHLHAFLESASSVEAAHTTVGPIVDLTLQKFLSWEELTTAVHDERGSSNKVTQKLLSVYSQHILSMYIEYSASVRMFELDLEAIVCPQAMPTLVGSEGMIQQ